MTTTIRNCLAIATLAGLLLFAGCGGKKTCHFVASDARGLEPGAPVVWYNATVGSVSEVGADGDGVRVDIAFDTAHATSIHDGVTAWIASDPGVSSRPYVELVGGRDENRPVLANGVRIPAPRPGSALEEGAMRFTDWLSGRRTEELGFLVALLAFLKLFGKKVGVFLRRLLLLAVVAAVAYIVWSVRTDWQSHRERFSDLKQSIGEWVERNHDRIVKGGETIVVLEPLADDDGE